MGLIFDGFTFTGGIAGASGATPNSNGKIGRVKCTLQKVRAVGASYDPFRIELTGEGCDDCVPQPGDWIEARASTLLFIDRTTYRWSLCGGKCRGEKTSFGYSLGVGIKELRWVV